MRDTRPERKEKKKSANVCFFSLFGRTFLYQKAVTCLSDTNVSVATLLLNPQTCDKLLSSSRVVGWGEKNKQRNER